MNKVIFLLGCCFSGTAIFAAELPWTNSTQKYSLVHQEKIKEFEHETFDQPEQLARELKKYRKAGKRTEAVLLIQDGQMIYEKYDREMTGDTRHISWSMTKSITSLLYGVAFKEKLFVLDDSICKFIDPPQKKLCAIKIQDVLQWATGFDWLEDYEKAPNLLYSSVLNLLYGEGHRDMAAFVIGHSLASEPGKAWKYSSGDSILASYLLAKMYKTENLQTVFRDKIFKPIGISKSMFETDPTGTIVAASYLQVTPYDLARLGILVMNNGNWQGNQILDPKWMAWAKTPSPAFIHDTNNLNIYFGAGQWWTNDAKAASRPDATLKDLPPDTFYAMGHWGQYLIVVPSKKLIAIRMGDCRDGQVEVKKFAASVAKLVSE